jgi:GNAT superfamily N-acetyltransferase
MNQASVTIRRADRLDVPFLRSLLGFAYDWHVRRFDTNVSISHYVDGWGRKGDTALIAMEGGHSIGAAWYRLFPATSPGYGFVDDRTPELTAVVVPTRQGLGIGTQLLDAIAARAKADGYPALSVSVRSDHPDLPLFLEHGFEQIREEDGTLTLQRLL